MRGRIDGYLRQPSGLPRGVIAATAAGVILASGVTAYEVGEARGERCAPSYARVIGTYALTKAEVSAMAMSYSAFGNISPSLDHVLRSGNPAEVTVAILVSHSNLSVSEYEGLLDEASAASTAIGNSYEYGLGLPIHPGVAEIDPSGSRPDFAEVTVQQLECA